MQYYTQTASKEPIQRLMHCAHFSLHVFREIRVLIVSVAHALRSLVWVVMAQMLLMYMFALLLVRVTEGFARTA